MPEVATVKGGDARESDKREKSAVNFVKTIIDEAIAKNLDLQCNLNAFHFADLGCSGGRGNFSFVQNVAEAVERKLISQGLTPDQMPDFQVFVNDLPFNDFNTLFASLSPTKKYFSAGVPGSFYGRLFPKSSLHFVNSFFALQWLSQVPEELLDQGSPTWNKGRVHYANAPKAIVKAFANQFARDASAFLDARAKELVDGGMILLLMPSTVDENSRSNEPLALLLNYLGSCLMDMASEGLVFEGLVDSFNVPVYISTPKEVSELVEQNGCFSIERLETTNAACQNNGQATRQAITMMLRSGLEGIISLHFGEEIMDELFNRLMAKVDDFLILMALSNSEGKQLAMVLKRKCNA